jgi:hypothetical protein
MKKILFFLLISFFLNFKAQTNDRRLKIRPFKMAVLTDSLQENSGLTLFKKRLFTINDSGNGSELFEINKASGEISNIFKTNQKNIDWEAIASDSSAIYIGDFGNNNGARKDLKIYKIELDRAGRDLSFNTAQEFPYFYPEQIDFIFKNLNTNFDAEAMIFLHGKIHVFTKEWVSKATTHYTIDLVNSVLQSAVKIETFPTDYVVTDASYFEGKLYLIGYTKQANVYMSVFEESKPGIFFEQKPQKYYLGTALSIGQIEGIAVDKRGVYISGEQFKSPFGNVKPKFYFVPHSNLQ